MAQGQADQLKRAAGWDDEVVKGAPMFEDPDAKKFKGVLPGLKRKYGFTRGTDERAFAREMASQHAEAVALRDKLYEREEDQAQAEREARIAKLERQMDEDVAELNDEVEKRKCIVM